MYKKIHVNPILKKELIVGSRSMKMSWIIMGLNAFLTIIVLIVLSITNMAAYTSGYDYATLIWLFPILGCAECCLLSLIIPIVTSGSISGERERQTLDVMLSTPVSTFSIVSGKLGSAMFVVMMYMITSIPVMAIAFVLGGMSWWALLGLFALLLYLGFYVGSIGVFCSSVVKKSILSTILAFAIAIGVIVLTAVILYIAITVGSTEAMTKGVTYEGPGAYTFVMFLNPYSPILDFMLRVMTGKGMRSIMQEMGTTSSVILRVSDYWIAISVTLNLLIAFLFLKMAAHNISVSDCKKKQQKNL